jgi:hypothetical protein
VELAIIKAKRNLSWKKFRRIKSKLKPCFSSYVYQLWKEKLIQLQVFF